MPLKDVEDFYPLSPLQQGLLFHSLSDPDSRMYFNQTLATLRGDLDVEAFRQAWQQVVDRHAVLRTFFVWEGVETPIQVVKKGATMPLELADWSGLSADERATRSRALRKDDLERGFDLSQAPLMRATLLRTGGNSHDLLWAFHHLLMDGWSMFHVLGEVFAAYDALRTGGSASAPTRRRYREYIAWLQKQSLSRAETFWRRTLAGFTAPTPLPADRSPDAATEDFESLSVYVSEEAMAGLQALARTHRLTLNTVLQGIWALLLGRTSGEEDVVFGAVVSGRPPELDGVEEMVGLFINSLPIRVQIPRDDSLLDWMQRLQVEQAELREFEYSPLFEVQGWSDVPAGTALFESLFLFENYHKDVPLEEMCRTLALGDIQWFERHNYPIAALAIPDGKRLELKIVYQTARFSAATIQRMLEHWRTLLVGMVADPQARVADLSLLTPPEREQLAAWNDTDAEIPEACVHALFEAQADRTPDAPALVGDGRTLSYRELDERANRLAHHLRGLGVGPGELVALCTERTPEMMVGILGTLKAGGAYVPLDLGVPAQRLGFMLADAGVKVVLTRASLADTLPAHDAATVVLDAEWDAIAAQSADRPTATATPSDLAYVIYTSGSTGTPKGVEVEHAALVNLLTWHRRAYDVGPDDRATHLAGLGFDASVWEVWPYLTAGASLHLVDDESRLVPANLLRFLAEHRITQAFVPTPMAESLLREEIPPDLPLEVMLTGGDKLNRAPDRALPFRLFNQYGPTENTVVATACEVPPAPDDDSAPPIGGPIDNVRCHLLDRAGQLVPVGVPGELFIGGRSLARGYRGRPDLTAAAFVTSPFDPGERLYATGDLGRWTADGHIEFLGRRDDQVKVRGFRIELGEIEVNLGRHPAVSDAVVLAREDTPGEKQLVAYVVLQGGEPAGTGEIRDFLKERLPDYMVPAAFVTLDAFPLSGSGKVDRRALPPPDASRPLETEYAAPEADIERTIADIWQQVLDLDRVGVHDNFFDLGGHSVHLVRVHGELKTGLGREIPMVDMFRFPTVSTLARHLGEGDTPPEPDPSESPEKVRAGRSRLAQLQQRRKRGT